LRTHEFRAWNKTDSEMYYGDRGHENRLDLFFRRTMYPGKDFVVMEFTGFYDLNGLDPSRKLWEGDVLVFNALNKPKYGVITWDLATGQWFVLNHNYPYALHLWLEWGAKYAGNARENKDLVPWWKEDQTNGSSGG
jgi:hypothetical protein